MTDIITGPGEYRTRSAGKATVEYDVGGHYRFMGHLEFVGSISWSHSGAARPPFSVAHDIVGPWVEPEKPAERQGFEPFWVVLALNDTIAPEVHEQFTKYKDALEKAKEEAKESPDMRFYILKAVGVAEGSVTVDIKEASDD